MPRQPLPPKGFVHLLLLAQEDPLYLEIPIQIIHSVCLKPRKYLRFIGWCVLGIEGDLVDKEGAAITDLNGELLDQGVYQYILPGVQNVLEHAVDLEVIRTRTLSSSESASYSTSTDSQSTESWDDEFLAKILARDGVCVWTSKDLGTPMHIIPSQRGSEWLQLIIGNRLHVESQDLDAMLINDIRNGIFASRDIHRDLFDPRKVVVLKTPNAILGTDDVPPRHQRQISAEVSYPTGCRYTLQWLVESHNKVTLAEYPNNNDATFADDTLPKPADLLLHYNYGAAAVKHWGKNTGFLNDRPNVPRPIEEPKPKRVGQSWAKVKAVDAEHDAYRVAEEIVLFFWSNTEVASERRSQKEKELTDDVEHRRSGVNPEQPGN